MALFEKTDSFLGRYKRIVPVAKVLKPVFTLLFYVLSVLFALFIVIAFILFFVNVDAGKMLLPPDMHAVKDEMGNILTYSLKLGNGIRILSPAAEITTAHIKLVIYAKLCGWCVTFISAAPIFRLLSRLFHNVANGDVLSEENAKYINYTGIIIIVGDFVYRVVANVFNYEQVRRFTGVNVGFSFDINYFGIMTGLFIIVIGTIYGYACAVAGRAGQNDAPGSIVAQEDWV